MSILEFILAVVITISVCFTILCVTFMAFENEMNEREAQKQINRAKKIIEEDKKDE